MLVYIQVGIQGINQTYYAPVVHMYMVVLLYNIYINIKLNERNIYIRYILEMHSCIVPNFIFVLIIY